MFFARSDQRYMSFLSKELDSNKIGIVIGIIVVGLIGRIIWAGGIEEYFSPNKQVENAIVSALESQPGGAIMLSQLESDFPLEYEDLLSAMTNQAVRDQSPDNIVEAGNQWLRRFFASHSKDFKFAPIGSLDTVLSTEATALAAMYEHEPQLCDNYIRGWALPGNLPEKVSQSIGSAVAAKFAAIRAGRDDQQLRLDLTPYDLGELTNALTAGGMNEDELAFVLDGVRDGVEESGEKCKAIQGLVAGVQNQPEDRRALLVSAIVVGK